MKKRTMVIIAVVIILGIISLLIPTIREGRDLTSRENDREDVIYEGNTDDTGNTGEAATDTTMVDGNDAR